MPQPPNSDALSARAVDYDRIAADYDRRYAGPGFPGIEQAIAAFAPTPGLRLLEVGCGTGHWLALLAAADVRVAGLDRSTEMLIRARQRLPDAPLVRGRAEALPWADACFDRVLCVNALHHFDDPAAFLREAHRVLAAAGEVMVIGLDPHTGTDRWWIYDRFEGALSRDRARYPASAAIRAWMAAAGFAALRTIEAEHIAARTPVRDASAAGLLARSATSQLAILDDVEYARGLAAIEQAATAAEARGAIAFLEADLRLHATLGARG